MPTAAPVMTPFVSDQKISSGLDNYHHIQGGAIPEMIYNTPQSNIVTPISLPGMPPITVTASLPQEMSFYTPVAHNNQFPPGSNVTTTNVTIAETITSITPGVVTSISTPD